MAIAIPPRPYSTFAELVAKWQRNANDIRYAIVCGALKPSVRLIGTFDCLTWDIDPSGDWVTSLFDDQNGYRLQIEPRGWQYLQDPLQTEAFDCIFKFATDDRDPDKSDVPFSNWHLLREPMLIEDVIERAVFLDKEVARYEANFPYFGPVGPPHMPIKPLSTRERDTLLTIIAALCKEAKIDIKTPSKAGDLIQSLTDSMGAPVAKRTIEEHLKKIPEALATRMK